MIVEDSKPMRNLIKRSLKQAGFGDHEVWEAGDGEEALGVLRDKKPDIVLSDWNMPKMKRKLNKKIKMITFHFIFIIVIEIILVK